MDSKRCQSCLTQLVLRSQAAAGCLPDTAIADIPGLNKQVAADFALHIDVPLQRRRMGAARVPDRGG